MKKTKHSNITVRFVAVAVVFALLCGFVPPNAYAGSTMRWTATLGASDAYKFPDIEISDTYTEKVATIQIPNDVLKTISTLGLIETCLNYPFFYIMFLSLDLQAGFERLKSEFNGIRELLARDDAAALLLEVYEDLDMSQFEDREESPALLIRYFEAILSQAEVINGLDATQKERLLDAAIIKFDYKSTKPNIYSVSSSSELCATTMSSMPAAVSADYMEDYRVQSMGVTVEPRTDIENPVTPSGATLITLYTPKGTSYIAYSTSAVEDLTAAEKNEFYNEIVNDYDARPYFTSAATDKANIIASMTRKYNCHSYAWLSQSSSNTVWINAPAQKTFWQDGSYVLHGTSYNLRFPEKTAKGYKVDYVLTDHSAVVHNVEKNELVSKWGPGPLMIHTPDQCPYDSTALSFYKQNY